MTGTEENVEKLLANQPKPKKGENGHALEREPLILNENIAEMRKWNAEKKVNGVPASTRFTMLHCLKMLDQTTRKPFTALTKDNLTSFFNEKKYASITPAKNIRGFFQWLEGCKQKEFPKVVEWIRPKEIECKVDSSKIMKPAEVMKAVIAVSSSGNTAGLRDAAMISFLFETGARNSELRGLKVEDVELLGENKARVHIHGTKSRWSNRTIAVYDSVPLLRRWIAAHPNRGKSLEKSFLFPSQTDAKACLDVNTLNNRVRFAFTASGNKKRAYAHLLRHSAATRDAPKLKEALMRQKYGWSPRSRQPSYYSHMSDAALEEALDEIHGIKDAKPEEEIKAWKKCAACGFACSPIDRFCPSCANPLNAEEQIKKDHEKELLEARLALLEKCVLSKNPDVQKFGRELIRREP